MRTLNIVSVLKKMTIRKLRDVLHENYCKRIGFPKEETYYLLEKKTEKKDLLSFAIKLTIKVLIILENSINLI